MSKRGVSVDGVDQAVQAMMRMAPAIDEEVAATLNAWSGQQVSRIKAAANTDQARLAAKSVRARKSGKGTVITAGGGGKLPNGSGGTYGDIFFGSEFGSHQGKRKRQFPQWRKGGYWFFPTLADDKEELEKAAEQGLTVAENVWAA